MDNQHKHIKGYRDLSPGEIHKMNDVKAMGETLKNMIGCLREDENIDQRWVSIAETHLQHGIMAAVRSIAQPESF